MKKLPINEIKKYFSDMQYSFVFLMIFGVIFTISALFVSHGQLFSQIFFGDKLDTGMDFFHSIEYTRGKAPYELFRTLYPPLANLFFYLLYCMVPLEQSRLWADSFSDGIAARGTAIDLRVWQATMLMFMIFIIVVVVMMLIIVWRYLENKQAGVLVGASMVFSYGVLYALERGNIIIVSVLFSMIFILFKDSKNKVVAELALLSLAIAAGLKLYPAFFGIVLLYDKQYKKAVRTVLYGISMFVIPFFAFEEGIFGMGKFFQILLSWSGKGAFSAHGYSVDKICSLILICVEKITNCGLQEEFWMGILPWVNRIIAVLLLIAGFYMKKKWEKVLAPCLALITFQSQGTYILAFLLIPLLVMIKEEKIISEKNVLVYTALVVSQIILPLPYDRNATISIAHLRIQVCLVVLILYILVHMYRGCKEQISSALKMYSRKRRK